MLKKDNRIYEIDILRFVAATIVFFFHSTFRGNYYELYSFDFPTLSLFSKYGFLGVDLFFIISGFVILMSVQNKAPTTFFQSRFIRLYPCFWFGVTFTALVCYFFGPEIFQPKFWQYLVNMTMLAGFVGVPEIDGVYWTLYVEIKFYTMVFLIMLIKKLDYFIYFLYAWMCLSIVNYLIAIPWTIKNILILNWAHYFIAGCVFYLIRRNGLKPSYLILLATSYIIAMLRVASRAQSMQNNYDAFFSPLICSLLISVFFIVISLCSLKKIDLSRYGKHAVVMGALSYPMYLLHHHVGFIYIEHLAPYMNKYFIITSLFALVLLISYICIGYEKWMANKLTYAFKFITFRR